MVEKNKEPLDSEKVDILFQEIRNFANRNEEEVEFIAGLNQWQRGEQKTEDLYTFSLQFILPGKLDNQKEQLHYPLLNFVGKIVKVRITIEDENL
jgi:hypothetical protein